MKSTSEDQAEKRDHLLTCIRSALERHSLLIRVHMNYWTFRASIWFALLRRLFLRLGDHPLHPKKKKRRKCEASFFFPCSLSLSLSRVRAVKLQHRIQIHKGKKGEREKRKKSTRYQHHQLFFVSRVAAREANERAKKEREERRKKNEKSERLVVEKFILVDERIVVGLLRDSCSPPSSLEFNFFFPLVRSLARSLALSVPH